MMTRAVNGALALVGLVVLAGCRHYWVEERALDAYADVPRLERKHAVLRATHVGDERPTLIRAAEAAPTPIVSGTRRRVRVIRPLTVTGLVLLGTGASLGIAGVNVAPYSVFGPCLIPDCGPRAGAGIAMLSIGGFEILLGTILASVGASTPEIAHAPPERILQPPQGYAR